MDGIDLSGVDPARWPEIRRRVDVLERYNAIPEPSQRSRRAFADSLGLGEAHFGYLARIWRERRNPADLPGAHSKHRVKRADRLPPTSVDVARIAIVDMGPMARRKDVIAEVGRRCRRSGVPSPSNSTIANMLGKARSRLTTPTPFQPEILIDVCAAKLPAAWKEIVVMPHVLMAVLLPERVVVAHEVSIDPDTSPSLNGLMEKLRSAATPGGRLLRVRAPHLNALQRGAIGAVELPNRPSGLPTLGRVLTPMLGGLGLIYQFSRARPTSSLLKARHASPLTTPDVEAAIDRAVAAHNASCPALPPEGFGLLDQAVE
jgi:hypothetical protein